MHGEWNYCKKNHDQVMVKSYASSPFFFYGLNVVGNFSFCPKEVGYNVKFSYLNSSGSCVNTCRTHIKSISMYDEYLKYFSVR